jgi:hypothetical protein
VNPDLLRAIFHEPTTTEESRDDSGARLLWGVVSAAAFGAVVGSLRGDMQMLSAALKMPFVLLLPLAVTLPSLHWLHAWAGHPVPWRTLVRDGATVVGRTGLLLLIGLPVVWLAWRVRLPHAAAVQLLAGIVALAFFGAMRGLFLRSMGDSGVARMMGVGLLAVTLGQTAWVLRPWVAHEGDSFRWFEDAKGDFIDGLIDPMYLSSQVERAANESVLRDGASP